MSWFNTLTWNFLKIEDSNKVLEVVAQDYSHHEIFCREDSLVLYVPSQKSNKYELVLHRPLNETLNEAYSICRCTDAEVARSKLLVFKDKLPAIVSMRKDVSSLLIYFFISSYLCKHLFFTTQIY